MYDFEKAITAIEAHINDGSTEKLRYAALEARIAIESVAIDRLQISRPYISSEDLRRWKPRDIMSFLLKEVDTRMTSQLSLSFSNALPPGTKQIKENYEELEWKFLGNQSEVNIKTLNKLWHKASGFLHVDLAGRNVSELRSEILTLLKDVLGFLNEIKDGSLVIAMVDRSYTYQCECGTAIKRNQEFLREKMIIGCPNPACSETYLTKQEEGEIVLENRGLTFACPQCSEKMWVPGALVDKLRGEQRLEWRCAKCDQTGYIKGEPKLFSRKRT
ncbi:MAG: hypothetical protein ACEPO2_20935 [Pelagibaca sp.]